MTSSARAKSYAVVERVRPLARARLRTALRRGLARAWSPPPKLALHEWADKHRMLSPESAALPGRWDTTNEPMAMGVMAAGSDPMVEKLTAMCAAQILKTEFLLNLIGFYAHGDPAPILMVQPTVEMGEAFSKDRLAPMIRDTPALTPLFDTKSRESSDTILHKAFPGGRVTIAGANAPAGLASRPIRVVLCDEVDRYPASAGKEGDPVGLAEKRTTTFWNRFIALVSTPTVKGESRIEESYEEGDKRQFYVPCPHCTVRQVIKWSGVKWDSDDPQSARYHCREDAFDPDTGEFGCGKPWTEAERIAAIELAVTFPGFGWIAEKEFKGHASFHASQLASKRVPLMRVVKEFLEAKKAAGVERLKQWINTVLAETWEDGGERADPDSLHARREEYEPGYAKDYGPAAPAGLLPKRVGLVTAGVDIQDNRWECEIVGWGPNEERWSLDYIVHMADPTTPAYWEALDEALLREFRHPLGPVLKISTTCIDTGGHHTQAVHDFCRPRFSRRIFGIKGIGGPGRPIWPAKATKNLAKNTDTYILGVDQAKSAMQKRLLIKEHGPGFCHFPKRYPYDERYFEQVTVEKAITKYKFGRPFKVWECPDGARNEAWDNMVYSYAALFSQIVDIGRRLAEWEAVVQTKAVNPEPRGMPGQPRPTSGSAPRRGIRSPGAQA
jgi:phage terminase large subunit GpA-like protein